ncbi:MAG: HEAT repeat domain-containing protein [Pseudomonadota bacterium]|nr:HEAT repeat domain-containing protein [Pseudomonadota bacterium]
MLVLLLLACSGSPGSAPVVRPLPEGAGPEVCAREPFEQLRIACLVESAARAGREGNADLAEAACAALSTTAASAESLGTWQDECHFRAGEELGRAGKVVAALAHCGRAGRFATFCTTHTGWGIPPGDAPLATWLSGVTALPEALRAEATDILRARWWFNLYFGTGAADPAPARAASPDEAPHARGAWALEAIRLTDGDLPAALAAWASGIVLTGPPLDRRLGRYDAPFKIPGEDALPRIWTFGGSRRFVGATPEEDLDIALLEGLYFHERAGAEAFAPFLRDPRPAVRYTALRCFRTLPSPDAEAVLSALAQDPDPIVAAHVADALKYQTWKGKPNAPGLR